MNETFVASLPWLPVVLTPIVALLCTPLLRRRGRTAVAIVLGVFALAAIVASIAGGGGTRVLEIVNAFPKGPEGEMEALVFERVEAPGWWWGAVAAILLGLAALGTLLTREARRQPGLVLHPFVVSAWVLAARLLLEKSAAPAALVWACGLSMAMVPFVLFQGLYAGRSDRRFRSLVLALIGLALMQRALVSAVSYWLTVQHLGTHLDFTPLDGFESRFVDEPVVFGDDVVEKWRVAALFPQMVMWAPFQVIVGLVVGSLAWRTSRRRI